MDEQEMQFANPDWQPAAPLPAQEHTGPLSDNMQDREQPYERHEPHELMPSYKLGYQGQQRIAGSSGQQPMYQQQLGTHVHARRPLWPWVVVIVALVCLLPALLSAMPHQQVDVGGEHAAFKQPHAALHDEHSSFSSEDVQSSLVAHAYNYNLAHTSTVKIDDPRGSIHVHGGLFGTTGHIEALSDGSVPDPLHFVQSGDGTLTIQVSASTDGNPVLLDLVLPENMALNLSTNNGNLEVDGIHGQVNLRADNSIALRNDSFSGQSSISSTQGAIQLSNSSLSGNYTITGNGPIALPGVALSGQGTVQAREGADIMMGGTLDARGSYTFSSAQGAIVLALPGNTAMQLHVDAGAGNSYSEFPTQSGSGARVTVKSVSGNIVVRRGS